jgi:hypothetical protein
MKNKVTKKKNIALVIALTLATLVVASLVFIGAMFVWSDRYQHIYVPDNKLLGVIVLLASLHFYDILLRPIIKLL